MSVCEKFNEECVNFLASARFARKKVNSKSDVKFPSTEHIHEHMAKQYQKMHNVPISLCQVRHYDETGWYTENSNPIRFLYTIRFYRNA